MDVENRRNEHLRLKGLAFFGAISASLSHEINNVLAIVGELSGLLGDLAHGTPNSERLNSIAGRATEQVSRGKRLVKRLNRFSHAVDQPVAQVSLIETLELITIICRRFADLRNAKLENNSPDEDLVLETSAFGLMRAVHICIDLALGSGDEMQNRVSVDFEAVDQGCHFTVTSRAPISLGPDQAGKVEDLKLLMTDLCGRVVATPERAPYRFVLYLPRRRDAAAGVD